MNTDASLLATLAMGLSVAFVGGYLAQRIRLPAIVGYVIAGVLVGPFTPGFVANPHVATELAEVGVILLMFGVGLHFSAGDLWSVRSIAIAGAVLQSATATILGALLGLAFGWGIAAGVIFGLSLSVASTVVLLRALMDRRELDTTHGHIAVGWLVMEDLFTILILVLLPSAAALLTGTGDGVEAVADAVFALAKATVLVVIMWAIGRRLLPWILLSVARTGSSELFTLAVLSASVGIAWISYSVFGVSLALGAFLAGIVLAESDLSHQAASDALPLRDAFAVLFFVSVGMLFDPAVLLSRPLEVLAVIALIVVGKSFAAFVIVVVAAYPMRTALTVAAGLAQVGEFTFILATSAVSLGLLPAEGFNLAVAGAVISISMNPFAFSASDRFERQLRDSRLVRWIHRRAAHGLDEPAVPPAEREDHRHAVVVGYGRVGSIVAKALERRGFEYVVIEQNRRLVEHLRADGLDVLYGDAADPEILTRAAVARATVLVLAVSDPVSAKLVVERVRRIAPRLDVVVRVHAEEAASRFRDATGIWPVFGERELAVQMARVTLRRFGVSAAEVDSIANGLRRAPSATTGPFVDVPGRRSRIAGTAARFAGRVRTAEVRGASQGPPSRPGQTGEPRTNGPRGAEPPAPPAARQQPAGLTDTEASEPGSGKHG